MNFPGTYLILLGGYVKLFERAAQGLDSRMGQLVTSIRLSPKEIRIHNDSGVLLAEYVILSLCLMTYSQNVNSFLYLIFLIGNIGN
jgi:hypothetical protein